MIKARFRDFHTARVGVVSVRTCSFWELPVAFAAMLVGYIAFDWSDKSRAARPLFFLIFSTLLMIASFRSRRFVEYWPPFAILFAAFTLQTIFDGVRAGLGRLPEHVLDDLQPFLDQS